MKLTISFSLVITLLLFQTIKTSVAIDQQFRSSLPLVLAEEQTEKISEDEAAVIAAKATGGRVISSETSGVEGVTVYRFKVLMSDGQVKIIQVEASSGKIL